MRKLKSPKPDEIESVYMPPSDPSIEIPRWKPKHETFIERQLRQWAIDIGHEVEWREEHGQRTTRADLLDKSRMNESDINRALEMGLIYEQADGSFTTLPKWARIDSSASEKADFTSLADPASGTPPLIGQVGADALIEPEGLDVQPAQVRPHLHYRGLTKRGNKLWTGERALCERAALLANAKLIRTKFRRHGKDGRLWLLVAVNPFNEIAEI